MKGKKAKRKKIGQVIVLALSFVLTVVLTATITLAWFYDSDWASNSVTMAGAVGIELRDNGGQATSGAGKLHFLITGDHAYPGQAIEVSASVFNNGGRSTNEGKNDEGEQMTDDQIKESKKGSAAFIRAHFAVYTDIGVQEGDEEVPSTDTTLNARGLYDFLKGLIDYQNNQAEANYKWVYYQNPNANVKIENERYFNGTKQTAEDEMPDAGYFYLCEKDSNALHPLGVGDTSVFLWDSTFVIPWQLTNISADKHIFVGLTFQAIQTFIPQISEDGTISKEKDNQLPLAECTYNAYSVQTVFNSCYFTPIDLHVNGLDFSQENYEHVEQPAGEP